ncbi:MAG: diaminopimelate epimerase [Flavobacteriales bacterium]
MGLQFEKWEGTGNDFVLVDGRHAGDLPSSWTPGQIQRLCDRRLGVGSDGVIEVSMNDQGHLVVDFRNPDGSRSFCGNGTRTALAWAYGAGLLSAQDTSVTIEAVDGLHQGLVRADGTPGISLLVDGAPRFGVAGQPASSSAFLDTGSPHHVMWLDSAHALADLDLESTALPVRHHEEYAPGGCNVNVVAPGRDGALHIRTFERGVEGETLSCGTGVVASALSDMAQSGIQGPSSRTVHARGGVLHVEAELRADGRFDHVWLWGAARRVFQGTWLWLAACLCTLGMAVSAPVHAQDEGLFLAETLSPRAQFSVLTASPGQDLYAAFGHTAFRLHDPLLALDLVFNYGTFVVDEGFYVRFVRGRMDYRLGVERYPRFQQLYLRQGRALHEHVLHLSEEDVRALAEFLERNALPENATYAYDFFRDNCASKVIDVLAEVLGADRFDAQCAPTDSTYLEALRPFMAGLPWTGWGMELILGAEASSPMPACGHAFLPDVLAAQMEDMTLDGQPLAFPREVVFPAEGRWHAGLALDAPGRNAPVKFTWGLVAWLALLWGFGSRLGRVGDVLSGWTVGMLAALNTLMTTLFTAMLLFTDHNDTWWNADLCWTSLGVWTLVRFVQVRRGKAGALGVRAKALVALWSALALGSTWIWPATRSALPWGETVVWASAGLALASVLACWQTVGMPATKRAH